MSALEKIGQAVSLRSRSNIFMEGERAQMVYNVTGGVVRLYRLLANGRAQVVGFALPGDFLGLPMSGRYGFSADTVVSATICYFPYTRFLAFARQRPVLLRRLHESAMLALEQAQDQMIMLGICRAEAKIAAFLQVMEKRRFLLRAGAGTVWLPMRRQDIGEYLGLSLPTVSRTIQQMCRQQIIRLVGKTVHILDRRRLQELASC